MTTSDGDATVVWASLPEFTHLLPDDHPCRVTVIQGADGVGPGVAIRVELIADEQRTVEVLDGDDPASVAARILAAADELIDGFDHELWLGEHLFENDSDQQLEEVMARVRAVRLRRIRQTIRKEYAAGSGTVPSADEIVEVVHQIEAEMDRQWYKPGR